MSLVRLIAETRLTNHGGGLLDANGDPKATIGAGEEFQVDSDNALRFLRRKQAVEAPVPAPQKKSSKKADKKG